MAAAAPKPVVRFRGRYVSFAAPSPGRSHLTGRRREAASPAPIAHPLRGADSRPNFPRPASAILRRFPDAATPRPNARETPTWQRLPSRLRPAFLWAMCGVRLPQQRPLSSAPFGRPMRRAARRPSFYCKRVSGFRRTLRSTAGGVDLTTAAPAYAAAIFGGDARHLPLTPRQHPSTGASSRGGGAISTWPADAPRRLTPALRSAICFKRNEILGGRKTTCGKSGRGADVAAAAVTFGERMRGRYASPAAPSQKNPI